MEMSARLVLIGFDVNNWEPGILNPHSQKDHIQNEKKNNVVIENLINVYPWATGYSTQVDS